MQLFYRVLPWLCIAVGLTGLGLLVYPLGGRLTPSRVPGPPPAGIVQENDGGKTSAVQSRVTSGPGKAGPDLGAWNQFRGPRRTGSLPSATGLFREWPKSGPVVLWETDVGEGHAGPAVLAGRVFLMDYDREHSEDALRCLSLLDGREIWRFSCPVRVKRNHGMSRTVPAVTDRFVVAMGPKCTVYCVDAVSGQLIWIKDLVAECGTKVPPWYAGQCPLIDGDTAILAPGADPLIMAVELSTGKVLWETPNPGGWAMTHSSVSVLEHPAGRQVVYAGSRGLAGVSARSGKLLWTYPGWRIKIANIPTPVSVGGTRLFLSGGYNAGAALVEIVEQHGVFACREVQRWKAAVFGSDQQTPILHGGFVYGAVPTPDGALSCLDLSTGKVRWNTGKTLRLGLGPYLLAGDLMYALNDQKGTLYLGQVSPGGFNLLDQARVLQGHDAWAPMALVGGRLLLRDLTHLLCIEVGESPATVKEAVRK